MQDSYHNGFKHKKSLGQNFLHDKTILEMIIHSIPSFAKEVQLVEIGIGMGDLTKRLLSVGNLIAYEVDSRLIEIANKLFVCQLKSGALKLINKDVLNLNIDDAYLFCEPYFLVSNLPYYIASAIILRVLNDSKCKGFIVMTQKEVAQKFCSKLGDRDFSALSIIIQSFGEAKMLFDVPSSCFTPSPKVTSSVFSFKREKDSLPNGLEKLLKASFLAPRKRLFSNLSNSYEKTSLENIWDKFCLEKDIRAHQVSKDIYHKILEEIKVKNGYTR